MYPHAFTQCPARLGCYLDLTTARHALDDGLEQKGACLILTEQLLLQKLLLLHLLLLHLLLLHLLLLLLTHNRCLGSLLRAHIAQALQLLMMALR